VRHAVRGLTRRPGFALLTCLTLALGVGANATVFSLANALLFRPLPVHGGDRLTVFARLNRDDGTTSMPLRPTDLEALRAARGAWSDVVGSAPATLSFVADNRVDRIGVAFVTENYFDTLQLRPAAGAFFHPAAGGARTADAAIVLAYGFWHERFDAAPSVIGRSISVGGHPVTIIGVGPKGFQGDAVFVDTKAFIPRYAAGFNAGNRPLRVLGILRPEMTIGQANASLGPVSDEIARARHEDPRHVVLQAYPERLSRPNPHAVRPAVAGVVIFGALTALVLALACTNVAGLLLVRADRRRAEMALRAALGATRLRLAGHLFVEALVLTALAATAGLLAGQWAASGIAVTGGFGGFASQLGFVLDWRTALFASLTVAATTVVVGMTPALRTARSAPRDFASQHLSAAPHRTRIRRLVIVVQTALALMLLVVAGLLTRSLISTRDMAFGFDRRDVVDFTMNPAESGYDNRRTRANYDALLTQVSALPGVTAASLSQTVPMTSVNYSESRVTAEGSPVDPTDATQVSYGAISSAYFDTLRIPIIAGRAFSDGDVGTAPRVAVVSAAMADRYWRGRDAVGQTFHLGDGSAPPVLVVGVASDVHNFSPFQAPAPFFYLPLAQHPTPFVTLQVRSTLPEATIVRDVRRVIRSIAPDIVPFDVRTLTSAIDHAPDGLLFFRLGAGIAAALGGLGLLLAVVGVYGVVGYSASQRTREMAVRLALGASPAALRRDVVAGGMTMVAAGVVVGLILAAIVARLTANLYVGISPIDPLTFGGAAGIIAVTGLFACDAPARRAMRVDPIVSLREQ
jgi:predicted permease